jgi:RNA polymerase sigma factor (TIGR02999 family)
MRQEAAGHTLQPTALLNEAYLRLLKRRDPGEDRAHFLRLAAATMRRVLVDHARRAKAAKRGGGGQGVTLDSRILAGDESSVDVLALEEALEHLGNLDPRGALVVELRFYGGLTEPEVARELDVSERTVRNDWAHAKAWLHRAMFPDPG